MAWGDRGPSPLSHQGLHAGAAGNGRAGTGTAPSPATACSRSRTGRAASIPTRRPSSPKRRFTVLARSASVATVRTRYDEERRCAGAPPRRAATGFAACLRRRSRPRRVRRLADAAAGAGRGQGPLRMIDGRGHRFLDRSRRPRLDPQSRQRARPGRADRPPARPTALPRQRPCRGLAGLGRERPAAGGRYAWAAPRSRSCARSPAARRRRSIPRRRARDIDHPRRSPSAIRPRLVRDLCSGRRTAEGRVGRRGRRGL